MAVPPSPPAPVVPAHAQPARRWPGAAPKGVRANERAAGGWAPDRSSCQEPKSASGTLTGPAPLVEMAPSARAPSPRGASRQPGHSVTAVASQMLKAILTPNSYGSDWCLSGETIHIGPGSTSLGIVVANYVPAER